ncbi:MAG: AAA-like domain-containing protein [Cyanobacteria bacterium J06639_14]
MGQFYEYSFETAQVWQGISEEFLEHKSRLIRLVYIFTGDKFVPMGFRASQEGLMLSDQARLRKGFSNKYSVDWAKSAFTTPSTLKRFWQRKSIQSDTFMAICRAIDCDWHDIIETSGNLEGMCYVRRPPIETECHTEIQKIRALIRIKAPMKMGKTSLISELVNYGRRLEYITIRLNMLQIEQTVIHHTDKVMRWFCQNIHRQVHRQIDLGTCHIDSIWDSAYSSNDNCTAYLEDHVLDKVENPVVLAIDNLDRIFPFHESAVDFLGLLRSWHEDDSENWNKLRIVLAHSTDIYPTLNVEFSPFNVGKSVQLPEFTLEQINTLLAFHQIPPSKLSAKQLETLVGGYPELISIAISHLKFYPESNFQNFIEIAPTVNGPYRNHLQRLHQKIDQEASLLEVMKKLLQSEEPIRISNRELFYLDSLGLIKLSGNRVSMRNQLYHQYFAQSLSLG